MVAKKKASAKHLKPAKKAKIDDEGGASLDDAFDDDEGVEYAESKPAKPVKKPKGAVDEEDLEEEIEEIENHYEGKGDETISSVEVSASKPIAQVKKGDIVIIDGNQYVVDAHYALIDHGSTKEMALEIFDAKSDKDFQIRYFNDQVNATIELYELQEILYVKRPMRSIGW